MTTEDDAEPLVKCPWCKHKPHIVIDWGGEEYFSCGCHRFTHMAGWCKKYVKEEWAALWNFIAKENFKYFQEEIKNRNPINWC